MTNAFSRQGSKVLLLARQSSFSFGRGAWKEACRRHGADNPTRTTLIWWPLKRGAEIALTLAGLLILFFLGRKTLIYTRIRYLGFIAGLLHYPVIYESHLPPKTGFQKRMEASLIRRPQSRIVVISRALHRLYQEAGLKTDRIEVAPDAGREINHRLPQREDYRGPLVHLGYIGSLYKGRGFEVIVEIAKRMPDKYFHVVGNRDTLSKQDLYLPKNIHLYDQVTPHQAELMTRLFDVLLMPYQREVKIGIGMDTSQWMSPLKMFEYMHSGRPVISSDLPVLREVLRDSENCLMAPPDDVDAWIRAIKKLDDEGLRYDLARRAFLDAREYTWEKRVNDILAPQAAENPLTLDPNEYPVSDAN